MGRAARLTRNLQSYASRDFRLLKPIAEEALISAALMLASEPFSGPFPQNGFAQPCDVLAILLSPL